MAKLPENFQESQTVLAIYDSYKKKETPRFSRRLGASVIGQQCARAVWYSFRWATKENISGRTLRLFETGNLAESRFVNNLRAIGCEVIDRDPDTQKQIEYSAVGGHVVVKLDAVVLGIPEAPKTWHAAEFKTHNAKSFAELRNHGVKKSKPQHYTQLFLGMLLAGLERGLYLAVNKDTDELFSERIKFNKAEATGLLEFAEKIITVSRAPEKISEDRKAFACKWCSHANACHGVDAPQPAIAAIVSCRTCCHASPVLELGRWKCERHDRYLSEAEQLKACEDHIWIPDFVTFADPIDGGSEPEGYVEYKNHADKQVWRNSKSAYRSVELTVLPSPLVASDEIIEAAKKELGGVVVEVE